MAATPPGILRRRRAGAFHRNRLNAVRFPAARVPQIVFGAGYGGYTAVPAIDETWRFYFVRGPLTAAALGLDADLGVGDAAILVRSRLARPVRKVHRISFMPHWETRRMANGPRPAVPQASTTLTRATRSKTS